MSNRLKKFEQAIRFAEAEQQWPLITVNTSDLRAMVRVLRAVEGWLDKDKIHRADGDTIRAAWADFEKGEDA